MATHGQYASGWLPFTKANVGWTCLDAKRHTDSGNWNVLPSSDEVTRHLELLQACVELRALPSELALLNYLVDQTLAGKVHQIKANTIAAEVFGRRPDYDPQTDPILMIRMDRLRRSLDRHYRGTGKNDPLRIDIPRGKFVPIFTNQGSGD